MIRANHGRIKIFDLIEARLSLPQGTNCSPSQSRGGRKKLLKATGQWHIFHHEPTQHRNKTCNLWYDTARATWVRAAHAWPRLELFEKHEKIKERSNTAFIFQENWRDFAALLKCFEAEILSQIQLCREEITELHYAVFLQQADKAEFIIRCCPFLVWQHCGQTWTDKSLFTNKIRYSTFLSQCSNFTVQIQSKTISSSKEKQLQKIPKGSTQEWNAAAVALNAPNNVYQGRDTVTVFPITFNTQGVTWSTSQKHSCAHPQNSAATAGRDMKSQHLHGSGTCVQISQIVILSLPFCSSSIMYFYISQETLEHVCTLIH